MTELEKQKKMLQGNYYDKDDVDNLPLDIAIKLEKQKQSRELIEMQKALTK